MMFDKFDHKTLQEMFDGKEVSPVFSNGKKLSLFL